MRVAFICGNLARYNVNLLRAASAQPDVQITVLQMASDERYRQWRFSTQGLDIRTLPGLKIPLYVRWAGPATYHINPALIRELREGNYDVLVTLSWAQGHSLMTLTAARLLRRPVVLYEASIPHPTSTLKRLSLPMIRRMIRQYTICIAGSSKCRDYLVWLGSRPEQVHLVRHPIDFEEFVQVLSPEAKRQFRLKLNLSPDVPTALFVGQFIPRKGVIELLEAWRALVTRTEAVLVLIGSGHLEPQIRRYIAQYGLERFVRLVPYLQRQELKTWYAAADFFVMPSQYDAFGAAAGEAMAAGLPVITTNMVGAEPDLIRDNESGIVIPVGNIEALEDALRRMLDDVRGRAQMGQRAQQLATGYATPVVVDEFLTALRAAMYKPIHSAVA